MKPRPARVAGVLGLAAATAAILATAAVAGSTKTYPTTVTITGGGPTGAQGTVTSTVGACKSGRTVHLLRDGTEVGSATTSGTGAWAVTVPLLAGNYTAKADSKKISGSKKADTSKKKKKKKKKRKRPSINCGEGVSLSVSL